MAVAKEPVRRESTQASLSLRTGVAMGLMGILLVGAILAEEGVFSWPGGGPKASIGALPSNGDGPSLVALGGSIITLQQPQEGVAGVTSSPAGETPANVASSSAPYHGDGLPPAPVSNPTQLSTFQSPQSPTATPSETPPVNWIPTPTDTSTPQLTPAPFYTPPPAPFYTPTPAPFYTPTPAPFYTPTPAPIPAPTDTPIPAPTP